MLDSQVQKVLDYIEANHDVSPARLCEEFGVSDRTIRTYVKKLNAVLEPQAHIHKHRGGGYPSISAIATHTARSRTMHPMGVSSQFPLRARDALSTC